MTVDAQIVKLRLDKILTHVERLKPIRELSLEEFLKDWMIQDASQRNIQIVAQAVIDICTHLVAHNHWGVPESYKDAVLTISQYEVIDNSLAERLVEVVKLRNVIVHLYLDIDLKIVYDSATQLVNDANEFVTAIKNFLER